jgi:hypothetical protein
MPETQQSTRADQNVSMSGAGIGEVGKSMPPKTGHADILPYEMDKIDDAVLVR